MTITEKLRKGAEIILLRVRRSGKKVVIDQTQSGEDQQRDKKIITSGTRTVRKKNS